MTEGQAFSHEILDIDFQGLLTLAMCQDLHPAPIFLA